MKKTLTFLITLLVAMNSYSTELNLDYSGMLKNLKSCRKNVMGCTIAEELELAQFEGKVIDSYQLNNYLAQDTSEKKGYFIPLSLTDKELLILAASTSLGIVAFKNDQEIMDVVQRNKSQVTETLTSVGNFYGSPAFGFVAAGSYMLGIYYDNNNLKRVGIFTLAATVAQSIVVAAVKETAGRKRPPAGEGPYVFFDKGSKSFFSGHTSTAFALATVLSESFKEEYPVVPWVAYGLAAVTAYARVHGKNHWPSDVIAGAIAGHLVAKLTMNALNKNEDNRSGFQIYPSFDIETGTVYVMAEWKQKEAQRPLKCAKMPDGMLKVEACMNEALNKK
ncbi:MAG: phosphatase PAP2 family protein [Bacteriovoracaceae bacterium]|nr:phosphatase PAP2 family protein [Bacteriovoracaceae bacterium]